MASDLILARISQVNRGLCRIVTLDDAIKGVAIAEALNTYARRVNASAQTKNKACELVLRHERRLGQIWQDIPKAVGSRKTPGGSEKNPPKTLKELGISKHSADRIREFGRLNDADFELLLSAQGELNPNRILMDLKNSRQREERRSQRRNAGANHSHPGIIVGDFREHADKVRDGSVSLIFTDPPYHVKFADLYHDLGRFAAAKLAEGGSLMTYVGHVQLRVALNALSDHLRFWWPCACLHPGDKALMREYGIRAGWKPILWFVKGTRDDKTNIVLDTVESPKDKSLHDWQQRLPDAVYYVQNLCPPDGLVCDPFLGSGTTAVACQQTRRKWVGFELDPDTAAAAASRIAA